ncbi:hypothetical protein I6N96_12570 [Enterococcus sp. BWM-S5]|uniref:Uncharacterized protein n=1 Tax=Enterococcus larvae TaxID=2794352 RepID=A0ABS4CMB3_9ENTE|nr:hypothetical protein [Enterococcus larvae]MBP1047107.1 hypothetical protein [Enterococcus larvae]
MEEIEVFRAILARYGLAWNYCIETLRREKQLTIITYSFKKREVCVEEFIADINGKTAYHATLSVDGSCIYIE